MFQNYLHDLRTQSTSALASGAHHSTDFPNDYFQFVICHGATMTISCTPNLSVFSQSIVGVPCFTEACMLLAKLNGGVTRLAPAKGMWLDRETGCLIDETTHVIYSYISEPEFGRNFHLVGDFIERFRTIANQEAVAVELDGRLYFVAAPPKPEAIRLAVAMNDAQSASRGPRIGAGP